MRALLASALLFGCATGTEPVSTEPMVDFDPTRPRRPPSVRDAGPTEPRDTATPADRSSPAGDAAPTVSDAGAVDTSAPVPDTGGSGMCVTAGLRCLPPATCCPGLVCGAVEGNGAICVADGTPVPECAGETAACGAGLEACCPELVCAMLGDDRRARCYRVVPGA